MIRKQNFDDQNQVNVDAVSGTFLSIVIKWTTARASEFQFSYLSSFCKFDVKKRFTDLFEGRAVVGKS